MKNNKLKSLLLLLLLLLRIVIIESMINIHNESMVVLFFLFRLNVLSWKKRNK